MIGPEPLSRLWLSEPDPPPAEAAGLSAAYAELFLLNVYPYGTVFTDVSGEMNGPEAAETARRFEAGGYAPRELGEVGAPDHVGLCLGYLEHLQSRGESDPDFLSRALEWIPVCAIAVEREPEAHPFYRSLAERTCSSLLTGAPEARAQAMALPEEPLLFSDLEMEVHLPDLVRFFLAPARCGMFLSRGRLGAIGREAGLRLPFASRFEVSLAFFTAAGEGGRIEDVLSSLEREAAGWRLALQALEREQPAWRAWSAKWFLRLEKAKQVLRGMKQQLDHPFDLEETSR